MPFSGLCNKEFKIFLSKNPHHHDAQVIPPKKTDKQMKNILKRFIKDLNLLLLLLLLLLL